jgi:ribonuclease T2
MKKYWKDDAGNDESFWEHEWNKHGLCISTLEPSCYNGYKAQEEVVDFFQTAVDMYKTLDCYQVRRIMKSGTIDRRKQKLTL